MTTFLIGQIIPEARNDLIGFLYHWLVIIADHLEYIYNFILLNPGRTVFIVLYTGLAVITAFLLLGGRIRDALYSFFNPVFKLLENMYDFRSYRPIRPVFFLVGIIGLAGIVFGLMKAGEVTHDLQEIRRDKKAVLLPSKYLTGIVGDEIKKLAAEQIFFNSPREMTVGVKEKVKVHLAKIIMENLSEKFKGRVMPQMKDVRSGIFIKTRLKGDSFKVEAIDDKERSATAEEITRWEWNVTPLKSGTHPLSFMLAVRMNVPDYITGESEYFPLIERKIEVKINLKYSIKRFVNNNWQWIFFAVVGVSVIWIIGKRL